jgi:UDPglucose 6-dehydrogenase
MSKEFKIGIIGVGVLGGTSKSYYEDNGYDVFCYDKFKNIGSIEDVNKADIVFVCVPTPRGKNNECNISIVDEAIGYVTGSKVMIIRSTVPPFTTDELQKKYPRHRLLFNPEFLTERRAFEDFRSPKLQIIGYTSCSETVAQAVLEILPLAHFNRVMPAAAAEMFKYVRNCYLATKNSFFNQIYDLCQTTGVDYNCIKECAEADPWIGPEHLNIWQDNKRGYNGKCLPKDSEAFLKWVKDNSVELSLLAESTKYNSALLKAQSIEKNS